MAAWTDSGLKAARARLVAAFVLAAAPYFALMPWRPYPGSYALKLLPLVVLAIFGARLKSPALWWVGLAFSAAGDVLLDLGRTQYMIPGIVMFSVAYVLYSAQLWPARAGSGVAAAKATVLLLYTSAFAAYLIPQAGELRVAVIFYSLVLANLGAAASFGMRSWTGFLGVCSLVVSDSLIGIDEFTHAGISRHLIMSTYYLGQLGVAIELIGAYRSRART